MWKGTVLLFSVLAVTAAYQTMAPLEPKPDKFQNESGCYISLLDKVIPIGQRDSRAPRGKEICEIFACDENYVRITGCGSPPVLAPCKVTANRDTPFPGCCPTIECP